MSERRTGYLPQGAEWGTLALILACYGGWLAALWLLPGVSLALTVLTLGVMAALHSSLTHEALHGHPFRRRWLNEALMVFPLSMAIPYGRFRDTHLAHHEDEALTDPYDDPESNFQDPGVWARLPAWRKTLLRINNTLLGRMVLGPLLGQICFMAADWRLARKGAPGILRDWLLHALGLVPVIWVVLQSPAPLWAAVLGAYMGLGILKIRTFLEHRAHETAQGRTVVIEDTGPLALLFLNNNLHIVHHMHPGVPWYALPQLYRTRREAFLQANGGYFYRNYLQIFRNYLLRAKDPVPHPLWQQGE
ncbi:fatty acid desaturase [Leisingera aquaemixtae]|uniref:fatty acid desaturase n=1 Tax=Leisingera aquaemixtae TaxID=1396826 RepID=UPI0021A37AA9|nr:fatty acid desaturase [Leisingera aquaemixtae]UWQ23755.1 fatty acid desaturase [Leisingera aquaemixtae]UWQ44640.1 fatty acid desaturase [Leisingera aquaemixtae]